jgi:peroxiredoxin
LCPAEDDLRGRPLYEVKDRPPAPDFRLEDTEGEFHRLSDYRGKVVILNFWATWCPPCRDEMPSMQRAWKVLKARGIEMLPIETPGVRF